MQCPECGKPNIKTQAGLRKHLMGGVASGGHDLPLEQATRLASAVLAGAVATPTAPKASVDEILHVLTSVSETSAADFLRLLLATLVSDKRLPKYQFERRIDCFLAPFLPRAVETIVGGVAQLVVPEFPLKKPGSNQSTNADHLLLVRDRPGKPDTWVLVELKTDSGSYSSLQADIYQEAVDDGWARLRADLGVIRNASTHKAAYTHLISRVDAAAGSLPPQTVEVLYVSPNTKPPHGFHSVHFASHQGCASHHLMDMPMDVHQEVWSTLKTFVLAELV